MDVIRFLTTTNLITNLQQGKIVNNIKSKMWIERYRDAGEFRFEAPVDSGIRDDLPVGALISHTSSTELMEVQNHEIQERKGERPTIVITGKSYETFLTNRLVGINMDYFPTFDADAEYILADNETWIQAVDLINDHISSALQLDIDNSIYNVLVMHAIAGSTGSTSDRTYKKGTDLYKAVLDLLAVDDLGIKTIRPGPWSPAPASNSIFFLIHVGTDRSQSFMYSYDNGEIESADYLWTNLKFKNAAYVSGKWIETFVDLGGGGSADRRILHVDASDIDGVFADRPTNFLDLAVMNAKRRMERRGFDAIAAHNDIVLSKAEISKSVKQAAYRQDFDIGDIVAVQGDYNESAKMRVTEYVEIEDENGETGYPTLSAI